jgi:glucose/arabinose dehydrogenase
MRMKLDGRELDVFASGVRNTVGFDWHPESGELGFTDNGRDWMGDDQPPDELNRAPQKGLHFGFPYCHGDILDPSYGRNRDCGEFTAPAIKLDPHVAALGMKFYTGSQSRAIPQPGVHPEHGSWNRSRPIGTGSPGAPRWQPAVATRRLPRDGRGNLGVGDAPWKCCSCPDGRPARLRRRPGRSRIYYNEQLRHRH